MAQIPQFSCWPDLKGGSLKIFSDKKVGDRWFEKRIEMRSDLTNTGRGKHWAQCGTVVSLEISVITFPNWCCQSERGRTLYQDGFRPFIVAESPCLHLVVTWRKLGYHYALCVLTSFHPRRRTEQGEKATMFSGVHWRPNADQQQLPQTSAAVCRNTDVSALKQPVPTIRTVHVVVVEFFCLWAHFCARWLHVALNGAAETWNEVCEIL